MKFTRFKVTIECERCGSVNLQIPTYAAETGSFSTPVHLISCCEHPKQKFTLAKTDEPFRLVNGNRPPHAL